MDTKNIIVTKTELAEFLGVSQSVVTRMVKNGMPASNPKKLNLAECIKWQLDQNKVETTQTQSSARTKLIEAQTRRIKLQIMEKRGDLVEVEIVKMNIQKTIETIKQRISTLITKLPVKLENKSSIQISEILKKDVNKALNDIKVE